VAQREQIDHRQPVDVQDRWPSIQTPSSPVTREERAPNSTPRSQHQQVKTRVIRTPSIAPTLSPVPHYPRLTAEPLYPIHPLCRRILRIVKDSMGGVTIPCPWLVSFASQILRTRMMEGDRPSGTPDPCARAVRSAGLPGRLWCG
jgi:hypothetical protein